LVIAPRIVSTSVEFLSYQSACRTRRCQHELTGVGGSNKETECFAENRFRQFQFQRESVLLNAPESSGAHGFYSALWIHLGEADNIRARLLEDLSGDDLCIRKYQRFGFAFELFLRRSGLADWLS
jgi:hypothetical protein